MTAFPSVPSAPTNKYMVLADGENLVFRYQEMLKTRKRHEDTQHLNDGYVWHEKVTDVLGWSVVRVNYYMSAGGGDDKVQQLEDAISKIVVRRFREVETNISPRVFRKEAKSRKTKLVDISLSIDALRHSYHHHVEAIMILSGDGDYLPLVKEIMRNGTQVWLGAFSDGLNVRLVPAVDRFVDLDKLFFAAA